LALIDLGTGRVERVHPVCVRPERVLGLALGASSAGPVAYLAIWSPWARAGGSRVVALQTLTGKPLGSYPIAGMPLRLMLGPGPGGMGSRLYCVEIAPRLESERDGGRDEPNTAAERGDGRVRWQLVGLSPATLGLETWHEFSGSPFAPLAWMVAPNGEDLYALSGDESPSYGRALLVFNATTGVARHVAALPENGVALAASAESVFVASPGVGGVWIVDRRRGQLTGTVPVPAGRRPLALTLWGA
jgi:hypothetical protein